MFAWVLGCAERTHPPADAAPDDVSRARVMLTQAALPLLPEVIAVAQSVERQARGEGAGARAAELHGLAARLMERLFRLEHRQQDGQESLDLYRAASTNLRYPGACEAAMGAATLAGEIAADPKASYVELYRLQRRASAAAVSPCVTSVHDRLGLISVFRPPADVLSVIDRGLEGEGLVFEPLRDAAPRIRAEPHLTRVEGWTDRDAARVVLYLDSPAPFRVGDGETLDGHAQTFVDFDGVALAAAQPSAPTGIVRTMKLEPTSTGSRVALELEGPAYRRVFQLLEPARVIIDIARQPPGSPQRANRKVSRVVIDPGHGGIDPGASGPSGLREKDVTLAIAHVVAPALARQGFEVVLTRDDDRTITLEERTARANGLGADLFISIHCNASENKTRKGLETYVLDTTTSELAGRVAARENATSQAATNEVAQLLASMRIADQASRSAHFADLLQRAGVASLGIDFADVVDGGVHRAGFYVLVGARMPAVLFETAYISHPSEETRLATASYQRRLADAVVNAVKAYREGR